MIDMATESEDRASDVVRVGRVRQSQHEAMAAVMTRILATTAGPAATTAQRRRKGKRVEWLGSVEPKTQRKRRKLKVNDL